MKYRKVSLLSLLTILLIGLTFLFSSFTQKRITTQKKAQVTPLSPEVPATMADYWSGKARWEFIRKYTIANTGWNGGFMAGDQIYILNGNWYLFSRKVVSGILTTEVRKSIDEGVSWSAPVDIIPENAKWGVAATDGSVFYNQAENRWYFLFQCLAVKDGPWFGCLLVRDGMDPIGQFSEKPGVTNPVINAKEIWSKICNSSGDHCVQIPGGTNRVYDEGTFNIFELKNGYYFVAFHGYDGKNGFRSIAKTMDFNNWIAGDAAQGVPDDSVFDKFDSDIWREGWQGGSIGGGAGSILFDNSYYYQVVEGADINLACTKDQKWDFGIYRSASLTNKQWEPYPLGNPIVYSSLFLENHPYCNTGTTCIRPCNVQYAHLSRDSVTNKIYFAFSRETEDSNYRGIYLYKLTADNNLLKNADLWKCNGDNWNRTGSTTNLAVYRYPNQSSDGNCYLATNCGSSTCTGDYSIFQDVNITPGSLPNVEFGGKFATDIQSGSADLYLWELKSDFTPLANHKITAALNTSYQEIKGTTTLRSDTSKLRFQLYLHTPNVTFKADEMFVQPYVPSPTPTPVLPTITPTPTLPCPVLALSCGTGNNVNVSWTAVTYATYYQPYAQHMVHNSGAASDGAFYPIGSPITTTSVVDSAGQRGSLAIYVVNPCRDSTCTNRRVCGNQTNIICPAFTPTPTPTPCPSAGIPTGLTCNVPGNSISWNAVSGASYYLLRVSDRTAPACPPSLPVQVCEAVYGLSRAYTFQTSKTYDVWVHSVNSCGNTSTQMGITCYGPTPIPTLTPTPPPPTPTRIPTSTPTRIPPTPTSTPVPCPLKTKGDANCDGVINILDFEIWRREFLGIDTTTKADFDSSGGVTILDFEIWRRGFLSQ